MENGYFLVLIKHDEFTEILNGPNVGTLIPYSVFRFSDKNK